MAKKTFNTRFKLRYDTFANWTASDPVLLAGELAIVYVPAEAGAVVQEPSILIKVGDGVKKFSELPFASGLAADVYNWAKAENKPTYEIADIDGLQAKLDEAKGTSSVKYSSVESVEAMEAIADPKHGDVCVVKETIDGTKVQYTAYVYDTDKWTAMDGNYSAENVILKDDITLAGEYTQVGNITKTKTEAKTLAAKGKSVADVFKDIFTAKLQPKITANPSLSVSMPQAGEKEVGTKVTPSYSTTFRSGSYTYGPATDITVTSYEINGEIVEATGTLEEITVEDSTNYKVTVKANHTEGVVAKDNLGNASEPVVQIAAGSVSGTSSAITGFRYAFAGYTDDTNGITSAVVRGLAHKTKATGSTLTFNLTNDSGVAKRFIVAVPVNSGFSKINKVELTSTMNLDITDQYVAADNVDVDGANNSNATTYRIFVYQPAELGADEVHKVVVGK